MRGGQTRGTGLCSNNITLSVLGDASLRDCTRHQGVPPCALTPLNDARSGHPLLVFCVIQFGAPNARLVVVGDRPNQCLTALRTTSALQTPLVSAPGVQNNPGQRPSTAHSLAALQNGWLPRCPPSQVPPTHAPSPNGPLSGPAPPSVLALPARRPIPKVSVAALPSRTPPTAPSLAPSPPLLPRAPPSPTRPPLRPPLTVPPVGPPSRGSFAPATAKPRSPTAPTRRPCA